MANDRHSIRLKNYDYTGPGAYFITLVTQFRDHLFGTIHDGEMILNEIGLIVYDEWEKTAQIRPETDLGPFQIMPNHFHAILIIDPINGGAHSRAPRQDNRAHQERKLFRPPRSLGSCMAGFKSATTKRINRLRNTPGNPVWQRNYYEHIIRNDREWERIEAYIRSNPFNWEKDRENLTKMG